MRTTKNLTVSDLAEVLFASSLQESDNPTPSQVRAAIERTLAACGGDCTVCAGCVAQEAGDHPERFVQRMHWALHVVGQLEPRRGALAA